MSYIRSTNTLYKRLNCIGETHMQTSNKIFTEPAKECDSQPVSDKHYHLETMFYSPLKVPEQAKYIQTKYEEIGGR